MDFGSSRRQELNKRRARAAERSRLKEKMGSASFRGPPRLQLLQMCWKRSRARPEAAPLDAAPGHGWSRPGRAFDVHAQELGCSCAFWPPRGAGAGSAKGALELTAWKSLTHTHTHAVVTGGSGLGTLPPQQLVQPGLERCQGWLCQPGRGCASLARGECPSPGTPQQPWPVPSPPSGPASPGKGSTRGKQPELMENCEANKLSVTEKKKPSLDWICFPGMTRSQVSY
ncbi:uncharacterized protein LOC128782071 [Vidua chalybeata]|uniref:uncharacterized protein LOC128782071 n=1 Tax=Vidua chalybeata TaxID=81927 RepID=UPI0023A8809D|nr:uncharacterized protein LOC128782071 [Vidua chalybeata]XP_053788173.1 uncharacterized protein LOC128782071 [Vidua chalybeata]